MPSTVRQDTIIVPVTRRANVLLALAQATFLTIAGGNLVLVLLGIRTEFEYYYLSGLREFAVPLAQLGVFPRSYATFRTITDATMALAFTLVGLVMFLNRRDDWMVMLVSLTNVTFGTLYVPILLRLADQQPLLLPLITFMRALGLVLSLVVFYYLMPDGRFVPRWTRWPALLWAALAALWLFVPDTPENLIYMNNWMRRPLLGVGIFALAFGSGIFAQIYRYRRVSGPVQRQQTKWVVLGTTLAVVGFLVYYFPLVIMPEIYDPGVPRLLHVFFVLPVFEALVLAAPAGIAFSVLRYRLWQVDAVINRTLVYGTLTVTLGLAYLASILLLQPLFDSWWARAST